MKVTEEQLRLLIKSALIQEAKMSRRSIKGSSIKVGDDFESSNKIEDLPSLSGIQFKTVSKETPADKASEELSFWAGGDRKESENSEDSNQKLKDYWDAAKYQHPKPNLWSEPWSAAFISFIMKEGGISDFPFSGAHTTWATKALENRKALSEDPSKFKNKELYILFKRDEVKPQKGDLAFRLREGDIDAWIKSGGGKAKSHSDVFISPTEVIGGNLGDSVKKAKFDHPTIIKKIKVLGTKEKESE